MSKVSSLLETSTECVLSGAKETCQSTPQSYPNPLTSVDPHLCRQSKSTHSDLGEGPSQGEDKNRVNIALDSEPE